LPGWRCYDPVDPTSVERKGRFRQRLSFPGYCRGPWPREVSHGAALLDEVRRASQRPAPFWALVFGEDVANTGRVGEPTRTLQQDNLTLELLKDRFVVRGAAVTNPSGLSALSVRDDLGTAYRLVDHGGDGADAWATWAPAVPASAERLTVALPEDPRVFRF
jgi:hypothetical protein